MNPLDKIYVELDACNAALAAHLNTDREPVVCWQFHPLYKDVWDTEYYEMLNMLTGGVTKDPF